MEKGLVVTANDRAGLTRLFNYPCVVKIGPLHVAYCVVFMTRFIFMVSFIPQSTCLSLLYVYCVCSFSSEQGLQRPQCSCNEVQISNGRRYGGNGRRPRRVASDLGLCAVTEQMRKRIER